MARCPCLRLCLLLLLAPLLSACRPVQSAPEPANVADITAQTAAAVAAFWDAFNAQDLNGALDLLADDAVYADREGVRVGPAEVRPVLESWIGMGLTLDPSALAAKGERMSGPFVFKSGGNVVGAGDDGVIHVRDGKITFLGRAHFEVVPELLAAPLEPIEALDPAAPPAPAALTAGQHPFSTTVSYTSPESGAQEQAALRYLLYLPPGFGQDPAQRWPLILYLHGSGEAGSHLQVLKRNPLPRLLDGAQEFPAIIVSPQLPVYPRRPTGWNELALPLLALLDGLTAMLPVDEGRVYLTGLSMGGAGTWELASADPGRFAALAPVAGFIFSNPSRLPENLCALKDTPVWAFHGALDVDVPLSAHEAIIEALRDCGGDPRFTVYPDADHGATWERAYADPALWEWLFAQEAVP